MSQGSRLPGLSEIQGFCAYRGCARRLAAEAGRRHAALSRALSRP